MASSDLNTDALSAVGVKYLDMPATPHRGVERHTGGEALGSAIRAPLVQQLRANAHQGD